MITTTKQINEKVKERLQITNVNAIPMIRKVVVNIGIGQAKTNPRFREVAEEVIKTISGQKPAVRKAKKAISGFKVRQGEPVGLMVTLRGQRMNDFLIKLANIVLPRLRDFRGLKMSGFDKNGNYCFGISEHIIFPEISHEKAEILQGLSISMNTTAKNANEGKVLLETYGFPFEKGKE